MIYVCLLGGSLFVGPIAFGLVLLVTGNIALYEFYRITGRNSWLLTAAGMTAGSIMFVLTFLVTSGNSGNELLVMNIPVVVVLSIVTLHTSAEEKEKSLARTVLGILYIMLPMALATYFIFPRSNGYSYTWRIILGVLLLVWTNDIGAYLVGISFGRHRLFERVSPGKSWEGAAGGAILTFVLGWWMSSLIDVMMRNDWLAVAGMVSVFGVYGDLTESMIKRCGNVKDSGNLIPGHGGVLDRIDSMLFVLPVVFIYLILNKL